MKIFSALAAVLLLLTACGFSPMYGAKTGAGGVNATAGLDRVDIAMIQDASGVYLRNILIDNFYRGGYPAAPSHTLTVARIHETENNLDVTRDSESTRKQIKLRTKMTLTDKATGKPVLQRDLMAVTSYNVLGSQFTTRVSEADAREAALGDLARQIENQIALYFRR